MNSCPGICDSYYTAQPQKKRKKKKPRNNPPPRELVDTAKRKGKEYGEVVGDKSWSILTGGGKDEGGKD